MDFKKLVERARKVRSLKEWNRDEYVKDFVGDMEALVKLTMKKMAYERLTM